MKTITEQIIEAYDELDELLSRPSISDHALELIDKLRPKINSLIQQYREKRKWYNRLMVEDETGNSTNSLSGPFNTFEEAKNDKYNPHSIIETIEVIRP